MLKELSKEERAVIRPWKMWANVSPDGIAGIDLDVKEHMLLLGENFNNYVL